jgi:hypothetical protein
MGLENFNLDIKMDFTNFKLKNFWEIFSCTIFSSQKSYGTSICGGKKL